MSQSTCDSNLSQCNEDSRMLAAGLQEINELYKKDNSFLRRWLQLLPEIYGQLDDNGELYNKVGEVWDDMLTSGASSVAPSRMPPPPPPSTPYVPLVGGRNQILYSKKKGNVKKRKTRKRKTRKR